MSDDFVASTREADAAAGDLDTLIERVGRRTSALGVSSASFASAMTKAFTDATAGGKQFDDVLKSMGLKLSSMAVSQAFKPIASGITKSFSKLLGELFPDIFTPGGKGKGDRGGEESGQRKNCCCQPATGGCFTTMPSFGMSMPSYFPSIPGWGGSGAGDPSSAMQAASGGGWLGAAMQSAAAPANVTVQIATPDADSFRRSEAYITGQIARAVARGQRSL